MRTLTEIRPRLWTPSVLAALGLALVCGPARAESAAERAKQELAQLQQDQVAPEYQKALHDPVNRAKAALKQAEQARQSKATAQAERLEALALEWAQVARALKRTAVLEKLATELEQKRQALRTQLERARVLLEETAVREGRAKAQLEKLNPSSAGTTPTPTPEVTPPQAAPPQAAPAKAPKKQPAQSGGSK